MYGPPEPPSEEPVDSPISIEDFQDEDISAPEENILGKDVGPLTSPSKLNGVSKDLQVWAENWGVLGQEADLRQKRAPSGMVFEVLAVLFCQNASMTADIFCISDKYKDVHEDGNLLTVEESFMSFPCLLTVLNNNLYVSLPKPYRTKFLSMGLVAGQWCYVSCFIYYQLKKASQSELIWEYAKKHSRTG